MGINESAKLKLWRRLVASFLLTVVMASLTVSESGSQPPKPQVFAATAQVISFFGTDYYDYKIGSGSFVAPDRILTNAHVVRRISLEEGCGRPIDPQRPQADLIVIRTPKEPPLDLRPVPRYLAKVVVEDLEHDLALLELRYRIELQGVPEMPTLEQVVQAIREGRFARAEFRALEQPFLPRRPAEEVQLGDRVRLLGWP